MEEFKRYETPNPYNYTDEQLAMRKRAIRDAIRDHPHIPEGWIEQAYDVVENSDWNELKKQIDNTEVKERATGGVIECMTVEHPDDDKQDEEELSE